MGLSCVEEGGWLRMWICLGGVFGVGWGGGLLVIMLSL